MVEKPIEEPDDVDKLDCMSDGHDDAEVLMEAEKTVRVAQANLEFEAEKNPYFMYGMLS